MNDHSQQTSPAVPIAQARARRLANRRRLISGGLSLACHLLLLLAVLPRVTAPRPVDPEPVTVELVDGRQLVAAARSPAPTPPSPAPPAPVKAPTPAPVRPPTPLKIRHAPVHPDTDTLPSDHAGTANTDVADTGAELSEAQLAGAATGDSGPPGGACNMARLLQGKLRRDPVVQTAVAGLAGKAIMVWNGDWVRSHGEDGKGLAAVREAIMWEVAFAPAACRAEPVRGLVLLSVSGSQGPTRLAVGLDRWRWSDLLATHPPG